MTPAEKLEEYVNQFVKEHWDELNADTSKQDHVLSLMMSATVLMCKAWGIPQDSFEEISDKLFNDPELIKLLSSKPILN